MQPCFSFQLIYQLVGSIAVIALKTLLQVTAPGGNCWGNCLDIIKEKALIRTERCRIQPVCINLWFLLTLLAIVCFVACICLVIVFMIVVNPAVVTGLGQLLVWEWQSESYVLKQQGHFNSMVSLAYSPDGQYIVTRGEDGKVSDGILLENELLVAY